MHAGPWSSPLYRPRCHWPHGIRGRPPKKRVGNDWLIVVVVPYAKAWEKGNFLFRLFSEFLKGEKHEILNSDGLNPLIMNLEASRYIFTTLAIFENRWFAWRKSPLMSHPSHPNISHLNTNSLNPKKKNPCCCAWKIKSPGQMCLNGSFLEFHSATRPSCHPPSSWTAWMSMDIMDGCHGQAATRFWKGTAKLIFFGKGSSQQTSCVFWGNGNIFVTTKSQEPTTVKNMDFFLGEADFGQTPQLLSVLYASPKKRQKQALIFVSFCIPYHKINPKKRFPALGSTSRKSSFFTNPFQQNKDMLSNAEKFAPFVSPLSIPICKVKKKTCPKESLQKSFLKKSLLKTINMWV